MAVRPIGDFTRNPLRITSNLLNISGVVQQRVAYPQMPFSWQNDDHIISCTRFRCPWFLNPNQTSAKLSWLRRGVSRLCVFGSCLEMEWWEMGRKSLGNGWQLLCRELAVMWQEINSGGATCTVALGGATCTVALGGATCTVALVKGITR